MATRWLYSIGGSIDRWLSEISEQTDLVTIFSRHTSASLAIQENADPDVLTELAEAFARLAAENKPCYRHRRGRA